MTRDLDNRMDTDSRSSSSLAIAHYLVPCDTVSLGISRMPATATAGQPLALFLPGVMTEMNYTCLRAIPLIPLFDMVVCELPGHGISCEVADVSPVAMAREYAALIDRYVPAPQPVSVIGESFGGLIGAALAELRPDRVDHLVLLDTPFCLTRPPLAAMLSTLWQRHSMSPYFRRIFLEVFGFDPQDGKRREAVGFHSMLAGLHADCTVLAGCEDFVLDDEPVEYRSPSHMTNADLVLLRAYEQVTVLPRIESAGHCLLLDNPGACVAALASHLRARARISASTDGDVMPCRPCVRSFDYSASVPKRLIAGWGKQRRS